MSNRIAVGLMLLLAVLAMPVGSMLSGAAFWGAMLLGVSAMYICAHRVYVNGWDVQP